MTMFFARRAASSLAAKKTRNRARRTLIAPETLENRTLSTADLGHAAALLHPHHAPHRSTGGISASRALTPHGRTLMNVVYTTQGGAQHLDLYVPGGTPPPGGFPVILALPGGGWRWVRREGLGQTVRTFTKYGYAVAVADYAFASSSPQSSVWPTNLADVRNAVTWLKSKAVKFQLNPDKVALWGESAGGHLAALAGLEGALPSGDPAASVRAVIDFYGPTDLTALYADPKTAPFLVTFLGGTPAQVPDRYAAASPVDHVTSAAPPFLIFQGTADTAVPPAQSGELYAKLKAAGVPVKIEWAVGQPHGFRLLKVGPIDYKAEVLAFLNSALNGQGIGAPANS